MMEVVVMEMAAVMAVEEAVKVAVAIHNVLCSVISGFHFFFERPKSVEFT